MVTSVHHMKQSVGEARLLAGELKHAVPGLTLTRRDIMPSNYGMIEPAASHRGKMGWRVHFKVECYRDEAGESSGQ